MRRTAAVLVALASLVGCGGHETRRVKAEGACTTQVEIESGSGSITTSDVAAVASSNAKGDFRFQGSVNIDGVERNWDCIAISKDGAHGTNFEAVVKIQDA